MYEEFMSIYECIFTFSAFSTPMRVMLYEPVYIRVTRHIGTVRLPSYEVIFLYKDYPNNEINF